VFAGLVAAAKFFSQVIENCEVIGKDVVNDLWRKTKNRLMRRLTGEQGLSLRRLDQRARFCSDDSRNTSLQNG
jgi:hypothetical protein